MWVHRSTEDNRWQVGFFLPDGSWFTDEVFSDMAKAATWARWHNNGRDDRSAECMRRNKSEKPGISG